MQRSRVAAARQRAPRQLRSPQMQGAAQRAGRREGREMPRRLFCSMHYRDRAFRVIPEPRKTRTTCGSTSTTSWGSAPMCRSKPATSRIHCTRWSAGRSSNCACPIRWVFSRRAWKAASTTRMPAGRGAAKGDLGQPHPLPHRRHRRARSGRPRQNPSDPVQPARGQLPDPPRPARTLSQGFLLQFGLAIISCSLQARYC